MEDLFGRRDINVAEALKTTMPSLFYVDEEISIQIEFLFCSSCTRFHISEKSQSDFQF